jgi:SAM-dependent methyltransferase
MRCLGCGSVNPAKRKWTSLPFFTCASCGVLFVDPQPSDGQLERAYRERYYPADGSGSHPVYENTPRPLVEQLVACLDRHGVLPLRNGPVLDFGCGVGEFAEAAMRRGADVDAVEGDEVARTQAARLGVAAYKRLADIPRERRARGYDLITLLDVLEHVRDPLALLTELRTLVRPGGACYLSVPDYRAPQPRLLGPRWDQALNPTHLFLFSRRSLRHLLGRAGFVASYLPCALRDPRMTEAQRACSVLLQRLRLSGTLRILARAA